jgi:hypothetical protein
MFVRVLLRVPAACLCLIEAFAFGDVSAIYIHTYIHTYIHIRTCVCVCVCEKPLLLAKSLLWASAKGVCVCMRERERARARARFSEFTIL